MITGRKEINNMETKDVILALRTKNGLSQDELAEKIHVTRHGPVIIGLN